MYFSGAGKAPGGRKATYTKAPVSKLYELCDKEDLLVHTRARK